MAQFNGSIAQSNVQFPIESVIEPMAGSGYSRAMIFVPISKAASYLAGIEHVQAGTLIELNSSNFGSLTSGLLKTWLIPFFALASAVSVGIAVYDDDDSAQEKRINDVYEKFKFYAYFKFGIEEGQKYITLQTALSNLCAADLLYSRLWIGVSDKTILKGNCPLVTALSSSAGPYRLVYNPDSKINAALAQLGKTLSTANKTGTPVGNSIDMAAFSTIKASGEDDEEGNRGNLSATEKAALDNQKTGYQTYVGDGSENVVTEGSLYSDGSSIGAEWIKDYITYMCKAKTANFMSRLNSFKNSKTYQGILLILESVVKGFLDMGRLGNFVVTAPAFEDLPKMGDSIMVPNAWKADFIDSVRSVTVFGTLYITNPTR